MRHANRLIQGVLSTSVLALAPALAFAADSPDTMVEELVVTASKTGENVRLIAGSVTAITGEQLEKAGAESARDYLATTPGVVFNQQNPGFSTITIRGVNTSTSFANISQGTTGSYINDIPLTDPFFSAGTPDIDTFDVRDIQIYRGPQGTLFGSSSLGGAVNYIASGADTGGFDAAAETTLGYTDHAGGPNATLKGMVNIPIVKDRLALRLVGTYRNEAGYIDNLGTGVDNSNRSEVGGGRLMAAWTPNDATKVSWLSLYQEIDNRDAPYQDPDFGDLRKFTNLPETSKTTVQVHSLRLDHDLGFATLTALGSYHRKTGDFVADIRRFSLFGFEAPHIADTVGSEGATFEVRLVSRPDGPVTWLVGAMYDRTAMEIREEARADNAADVADALLGPGSGAIATVGDIWGITENEFVGKEMAVFGEASYTFADRLKLTVGGRAYKTETDSMTTGFGLLYAAFVNGQLVSAPPAVQQSNDGINPKASLSFDVTSNVRIYALASKGFRFGGANVNPDPSLPTFYQSDSLWNYEGGIKSRWLDGALTIDAALFDIEWSDIQLTVVTAQGTQGIVNAGEARIQGAEASLNWRPVGGLSVDTTLTYLDATLESVNAGRGQSFGIVPGSRLPGASRWLISAGARYEWDTPYAPFVAASWRYISSAPALLQQFPLQNPTVGDYNVLGVRAGFTLRNVQLTAFVDNLADERGVASATYTGNFGNTVNQYVIQPRTFGVTTSWKY